MSIRECYLDNSATTKPCKKAVENMSQVNETLKNIYDLTLQLKEEQYSISFYNSDIASAQGVICGENGSLYSI